MKCNLSVRSCVFGCLGFSNTNDLAPVSVLGSCLASVHSGTLVECVFLFGVLRGLPLKMDQDPYKADLRLDINP